MPYPHHAVVIKAAAHKRGLMKSGQGSSGSSREICR
jgi:hypothetical protein